MEDKETLALVIKELLKDVREDLVSLSVDEQEHLLEQYIETFFPKIEESFEEVLRRVQRADWGECPKDCEEVDTGYYSLVYKHIPTGRYIQRLRRPSICPCLCGHINCSFISYSYEVKQTWEMI